jgi:pimeloyl-ACP methyl ester carboxylesterase
MFITLPDAKLFTTAFGRPTDPAFLALSGWIGSWEDWLEPLALLSAHWHTLSYDHRGSGVTIAPLASITFDQLVDDVFTVLDAYNIEQCLLGAMSMGAAVAFAAALRHPHRFTGLVIVNGGYAWTTPPEKDPFLQGLLHDYPRALNQFIHACVPEPDSDHIKQWGHHILGRATPEAGIALYRLATAIDLRPQLGRLTLPTLIIHGDADPIAPLASAHWLAQTLPNASLVTIPGAGHVPIMTRPAEVTEAILERFGRPINN